jgi:hypothetical protein
MTMYWKTILLGVLPVVGLLSFPLTGLARDDRSYEREEGRAGTRLSVRDQRSFAAFLDAHDETAQELYRNPDLISNERFLKGHADLRHWLDDHPDAAEAIQADPRAALWQEGSTGQREPEERRTPAGRLSERDLRSFEDYLDAHDETAQQLYQHPALINDRQFVRDHESLHTWLRDHPDAAEAIQSNPDKFLWRSRNTSAPDFLRQLFGR